MTSTEQALKPIIELLNGEKSPFPYCVNENNVIPAIEHLLDLYSQVEEQLEDIRNLAA